MKSKQGTQSTVIKETVSTIKEQKFDDMLTSHPVKGWYEDKRKE